MVENGTSILEVYSITKLAVYYAQKFISMKNITTQRLMLSPFSAQDAPFIFELLNMPEWIQFIGDRNIKTLADAEHYIVAKLMPSYATNGFGFYIVKLKDGETPIGMCGLVKRDSLENEDIGFAFLSSFTGKGYAFEAATATLLHAKEDLKLHKISAITIAENIHSIRLLEKIGLTFQKTIKVADDGEELLLFEKDLN